MSVTELDPLFGALHANGAAATPAEPAPPTPASEPAAALVTAPGEQTATPPAPELDQPEPAPQHDPELQPAELDHDPLAVEDDDAEDLGGFDAVTDSVPDFEDDEPAATVEVVYDDEPAQFDIPAPAAPPTTVAAPAAGGVFAAFTPEIPQPRRESASAVAPVTEQPPSHAGPRKLRLPSAGLLPSIGHLAPHLRRPKKRTIFALGLLALIVIAAAMGGPNKTPAPSASKPAAAPTARPGTPTKPFAPKAPAHRAQRAASPRRTRRAQGRVRTRVVIHRVAVPAPAATAAPATALAPSSAPVRRAPASPVAAAASEFRP